jgi:hypothetical protein
MTTRQKILFSCVLATSIAVLRADLAFADPCDWGEYVGQCDQAQSAMVTQCMQTWPASTPVGMWCDPFETGPNEGCLEDSGKLGCTCESGSPDCWCNVDEDCLWDNCGENEPNKCGPEPM